MANVIEQVKNAGVIGAGGAGFPTHKKLSGSYEYVIANGAECEPLLHCDQMLMAFYADEMIRGLELAMQATGATRGLVALKKKHEKAIPAVEKAVRKSDAPISVHKLGNYYPSGDEQVLVYEALGRIVPEGGRPTDVGCLVQNVQTLVQIADAVKGKSVTQRILSVHGEILQPKTLVVPIGTLVEDIVRACGGLTAKDITILAGGVMMGRVLPDLKTPIGKTISGLYILPSEHPLSRMKKEPLERTLKIAKFACEQCSFCTLFCPRYLLGHELYPNRIMQAVGWNAQVDSAVITGAYLCCECGICGVLYACPLMLSPDRYNSALKIKLREQNIENPHQRVVAGVRIDRNLRKIPVESLIRRLALRKYDKPSPFDHQPLQIDKVRIRLDEHIGAPAAPVVSLGDPVQIGRLIARGPDSMLSANYHASIKGVITDIARDAIEITRTL